jgi:hypothetical protein
VGVIETADFAISISFKHLEKGPQPHKTQEGRKRSGLEHSKRRSVRTEAIQSKALKTFGALKKAPRFIWTKAQPQDGRLLGENKGGGKRHVYRLY